MSSQIQQRRWQLQAQVQALSLLSPRASLDNNRQRLDGYLNRLDQSLRSRLEQANSRLAVLQAGLGAVSPLATLARGYAIVRTSDGNLVRSVQQVGSGERIDVQVSDGEFEAKVM